MPAIIGRNQEIAVLRAAAEKEESQLIAVYGRRRVGKTYLIRETFRNSFTFQHAGIYQGTREEQLTAFSNAMKDAGLPAETPVPENWIDAFQQLKDVIRGSSQRKKIVFIDELSWMDTPRSDLMRALEHFWNAWASARDDVLMILCSSATSWMMNKVIHNKGGLYNRLKVQIYLRPLSLSWCRDYANAMQLGFADAQILELYMVLGGIPFYWSLLEKGLSVAQNVDHLFFEEDAPLRREFDYLFAAIFRYPEEYLRIVEALSRKKTGLTREEILKATGIAGSGLFSTRLKELESCGFLREYHGFGKKKKESLYQLIDPYVLFYYHFQAKNPTDPHFWTHQLNTPAINTWRGLAFEEVCLLHVEELKRKLGITGVLTDVASFICRENEEEGIHGSQIDLVIQRADHVVNLFEMKYTDGLFTISKTMDMDLRRKTSDFQVATKCRDAIHWTVVTPYGLTRNAYAGNIQTEITCEDLFQA